MPIQARPQDEYSLIDFILENELRYVKTYIDNQTDSLHAHEKNIKDLIDKEIWIEKSEPMPSIGIDLSVHASFFTYGIFYKSTFVTLYSLLESIFKEITRIERERLGIKLKPKDLKGLGLLMYKDYMVKVLGIDFESFKLLWDKINTARIVRNFLVHDYLDYSDNRAFAELENVIKDEKYLELENGELRIVGKEYLLNFCSNINDIVLLLLRHLRNSRAPQ